MKVDVRNRAGARLVPDGLELPDNVRRLLARRSTVPHTPRRRARTCMLHAPLLIPAAARPPPPPPRRRPSRT
jgi:hypothetical protein